MKQKQVVGVLAVTAAALVCVITACGGGAGGVELPIPSEYSGEFTVSGAITGEGGIVRFGFDKSIGSQRAVSGTSHILSGWIVERNGTIIELKGGYDPDTLLFSLSGESSLFTYGIRGTMTSGGALVSSEVLVSKLTATDKNAVDILPVQSTSTTTNGDGAKPLDIGVSSDFWGTWVAVNNDNEEEKIYYEIHMSPLLGDTSELHEHYVDGVLAYEETQDSVGMLKKILKYPTQAEPWYDAVSAMPMILSTEMETEAAFEAFLVEQKITDPVTKVPPGQGVFGPSGYRYCIQRPEEGRVQHNIPGINNAQWRKFLNAYLSDTKDPETKYLKSKMWIDTEGLLHYQFYGNNYGYDTLGEAEAADMIGGGEEALIYHRPE